MARKTIRRTRHVPQRTCVGCRLVLPKRGLTRVVRTPEGVHIDPSGKLAGRGAYLHNSRSCWSKGLKGALAKALKTELTENDRQTLLAFLMTIPEEEPAADMPPTSPQGESQPTQTAD